MTPSVCEDATTLNVEMVNTNLIGYKDDGSPRTTRSEISTKVMVSNDGQKFVIGGVDKKQLIRSVSKVPWLGSIPVLGYVFTTESEVLKKSQVVAVVECVPVLPNTKLPAEIMNTISGMEKDIDNYGIKAGFIEQNDYGFNQFLLDKNKTRLDPLP
jgi:Flp pilus assembly secretin CpaC